MPYFRIVIGQLVRFNAKPRHVTDKFYKNNLVSKMKNKTREKQTCNRSKRLVPYYNNAYAHKCTFVPVFLETKTVVQFRHPSYSSDLSPCDLFFFTLLKNNLSRRPY